LTTILLDTHVLLWWDSDSGRLSPRAAQAIEYADELAVASITWFELAWLAQRGRIEISVPVRSWLEDLSRHVRTISTSPVIAAAAAALPRSFPNDPTDRIIYATALEQGWSLVTKDERLLSHPQTPAIAIW
jgi:PIN domain nuclease of toxin-antitoxin system